MNLFTVECIKKKIYISKGVSKKKKKITDGPGSRIENHTKVLNSWKKKFFYVCVCVKWRKLFLENKSKLNFAINTFYQNTVLVYFKMIYILPNYFH